MPEPITPPVITPEVDPNLDPNVTPPVTPIVDPNADPNVTPTPKEEEIDLSQLEPEVRGQKPEITPDPEDDEVDPDDEKVIAKVVDKKLKGMESYIQKMQVMEDKAEVDYVLKGQPELEKYREVALKYMAHPAYKNIPAKNILNMLAAPELKRMGAAQEREAQAKAKETLGNGTQSRPPVTPAGGTNWLTASKEEFEAKRQEVMMKGSR